MKVRHDAVSLMRAPGRGLLTVTTGSGEADAILGPLLGGATGKWFPKARARLKSKAPHIIGFPSDAGGGICRGAAHGPLHLRAELYKKSPKWAAHDLGDIPCIPQLLEDSMLNYRQRLRSGEFLWGRRYSPSSPVSPLNLLKATLVQGFRTMGNNFRPLVIGGDHSTSWAVSEALFASRRMKNLGVLHFDAHTDLLEERYGVEHCFATWAAHCMERIAGKNNKNFIQVGLRISGKSKSYWERKFGLKQFWMKDLEKYGSIEFAQRLVGAWQARGVKKIYVSFDVDALDPTFVPSTGTPEPGGLNVKWACDVITEIDKHLPVIAADIVELAPVIGGKKDSLRSSKSAAKVAEVLLEALRNGADNS